MFTLAPGKPPLVERLRLRILGQRDRRHYLQSLDSTATHAIIRIRGLAQAGQHLVNRQYTELAARQSSASAITSAKIESVQEAISVSLDKLSALDGRRRDAEERVLANLRQTLEELLSQKAANQIEFDSLGIQAQQALDSWVTYYNVMASIYVRHRMKLRTKSAPIQAEVPVFEPIRLTELNGPSINDGGRNA